MVKEWAVRPDLFPGRALQFVGDVAVGMKREGQKVEGNENRGKVLLAVAEIVFEMVTFGFEHVKCLIFNFPAGPAAAANATTL